MAKSQRKHVARSKRKTGGNIQAVHQAAAAPAVMTAAAAVRSPASPAPGIISRPKTTSRTGIPAPDLPFELRRIGIVTGVIIIILVVLTRLV